MSVTKKKRDKPCKPRGVNSAGINGAKRHPLTVLERVLAGKGRLACVKPVECAPWRGLENPSTPVFDAAQVEENKRLYPHLFSNSSNQRRNKR